MSKSGARENRTLIAIAMGGFAVALLALLLGPAGAAGNPGLFVFALAGAALVAGWLAWRATSARSAWGAGCLANGVVSLGVALGFRVQDELWSGRSSSVEDIDRAIGPLTHVVWALAARVGLIALAAAAILFAISYWLLRPPHRKA